MNRATILTASSYAVLGMVAALALTACAAVPSGGSSGAVPMAPFANLEMGIRGNLPFGCSEQSPGVYTCPELTSDDSFVIVTAQAVPLTRDETIDAFMQEITLPSFPPPWGTYYGRSLHWELYRFGTAVRPLDYAGSRLQLGVASSGDRTFLVTLIAPPNAYSESGEKFEAVFFHMLYALEPIR
jgi:hypothetical protein